MRLLVLGAPKLIGDSWQDDLVQDAQRIGWDVTFIRISGINTQDVVRQAQGVNLVLWCYTHNHWPNGNPTIMLRQIEDGGATTVGLHLDLYWGLTREQRIGQNPWWGCQYIYTSDGGQRDWQNKGVNHRWCPPAVGLHKVARCNPASRGHKYVFVGGYTHAIHGDHRAQLIGWARRRWGRDFHWYGTSPQSRVFGEAYGAVMAYANCVLGDSAPAPHYWSDRVVRVMAKGGVLAHPDTEGMRQLGLDDSALVLFDRYGFDKLGQALDEISPTQREQLRQNAQAVVREQHLWEHRLARIVADVGLQ